MGEVIKKDEIQAVQAVEPVTLADAAMSLIERAAANPDIDVDKLERLLAMRERVEDRSAESAFNEAMARVQSEIPKIRANAYNDQTRSAYANYEALSDALTPHITRAGFACIFGTDKSPLGETMVRITCDLTHEAGHSKHYFADLPLDMTGIKGSVNKTKMHGTGSTYSYGRRYLKLLMFDVAITEEDDDGNAGGGLAVEWVNYVKACERHADTIEAMQQGFADQNLSMVAEAWMELSDEEKESLWVAPTKAEKEGITPAFSIEQRKAMKTTEFREACRPFAAP